MSFVIAVDGPAGTGKGTVTDIIAKKFNLINIDTGAMYRCVALKALRKGISTTQIEKLEEMLEDISITMKKEGEKQVVLLDGDDVTNEIRTPKIDACVAKYAAIKCVRNKMTPLERNMRKNGNIIMEGRDIGTVVFPDADIKIYLDASVEERAKRRYNQNLEKGIDVTYEEILESIKQRNVLETQREIAPLRKAEDAIYIDTSNLSIDEVVEKIGDIIKNINFKYEGE